MTTPLQSQSNARNAQHSTGPRTDAGKARAARNAYRHGFCAADIVAPGEDAPAFAALLEQTRASWAVQGPDEEDLAEEIAVAIWRRRRLRRVEGELWAHRRGLLADLPEDAAPGAGAALTLGEALAQDCDSRANALEKLRRWWVGNERHLNRARERLALMQRVTRQRRPATQPEAARIAQQALAREIDALVHAPLPGTDALLRESPDATHEFGNSADRTQSPLFPSHQHVAAPAQAPAPEVSRTAMAVSPAPQPAAGPAAPAAAGAGTPVPAPADPLAQARTRKERRALVRAQRKAARRQARQSAAA